VLRQAAASKRKLPGAEAIKTQAHARFAAVDNLRLRFPNQPQADVELGPGIHGIGRGPGGALVHVGNDAQAIAQLCVDRRGLWLKLDPQARGVHVNGRPVRHMAMLRVGDSIYVDGAELLLLGLRSANDSARGAPLVAGEHADARILLRGVGGRYHGRSFTLERPRTVGRGEECDIRVDDPAFAERHARIEVANGQVLLRSLAAGETTVVNGEAVRDAVLRNGDQIVFDAHQRFVLEAPGNPPNARDAMQPLDDDPMPAESLRPQQRSGLRLPWLLLAALLLAAGLSGILLFGSQV
jgi:hypothetical protein